MTSTGSAPQWVTSLTGLTGVSSSAITNTALTSGRLVYSTTGGAQTDSANLTFDGTTLSATGLSTTGASTLVKLVKVGDSSFTLPAVLSATAPAKLYVSTATVTDGTSAGGATNTLGTISAFGSTAVAATNASVTYTNLATLYIAGAPTAGTNVTITNPYALYVAGGASYFGGAVTYGSGLTLGGNLLFSPDNTYDIGASGANRPRNYYGAGTLTIGGSATVNGTAIDINPAAGNPNISLRTGNTYRGYIEGNSAGMIFGVGASATTAVTILNNQNVGMGTTGPNAKLEVSIAAATSGEIARFTSPSYDSVYIAAGSSVSSCGIGTLSSSAFNLFVNGSTKAVLTDGGYFGVGVSSPAANFDLRGSGVVSQYIISTSGSVQQNQIVSLFNSGGGYSSLNIDGYDLRFKISGGEKMRIQASTGYVGINESNPGNLLHISSADTGKVEFLRLQSTSGFAPTGGSFIRAGSGGSNSVLFGFDYASNSFQVQNGNTAAATLTANNSGNVGIGTTSPNAKLAVRSDATGGDATVRFRGTDTTARLTRIQLEDYSGTLSDGLIDFVVPTAGTASSSLLKIGVNSPMLTMNYNGAVSLMGAVTNASGVGITFPATQVASSNANTLDDYEEGVWTPSLQFDSGGPATTTGNTGGRYIKIGRQVTCWFYINCTSLNSGSGSAYIRGLPYTNSSSIGPSEGPTMTPNYWSGLASAIIPGGYVQNNTTSVLMTNLDAATATSVITAGSLTGSFNLYANFTYFTD